MNTGSSGKKTETLRGRLAECREELLRILGDWHYLKYELQPRLAYEYECIFGDLETKIQEKDRNASKLERRLEILESRQRRGENISDYTIDFVNKSVDNEFRKKDEMRGGYFAQNNARDKDGNPVAGRVNFTFGGGHRQVPPFKVKTSGAGKSEDNVPHLYRKIVKKLHPDITGEPTEDFRKHWVNVQNSYKSNDHERLALFHRTLCKEKDFNNGDIEAEENALRNEIRELEYSIRTERRKIEQLKLQEPFIYEDKLGDNLWIAKRMQLLRDKIFSIDRQIIDNTRSLRQLTGSSKAAKID